MLRYVRAAMGQTHDPPTPSHQMPPQMPTQAQRPTSDDSVRASNPDGSLLRNPTTSIVANNNNSVTINNITNEGHRATTVVSDSKRSKEDEKNRNEVRLAMLTQKLLDVSKEIEAVKKAAEKRERSGDSDCSAQVSQADDSAPEEVTDSSDSEASVMSLDIEGHSESESDGSDASDTETNERPAAATQATMINSLDRGAEAYPTTGCFRQAVRHFYKGKVDDEMVQMRTRIKHLTRQYNKKLIEQKICKGCDSLNCFRDLNGRIFSKMTNGQLAHLLNSHKLVAWSHSHFEDEGKQAGKFYVSIRGNELCQAKNCRAKPRPLEPIVGPQALAKDPSALQTKMSAWFYASHSISVAAMRKALKFNSSHNTPYRYRADMDQMLAAAHVIDAKKYKGKAHFVQADEFCIGKRKYNKGKETNVNRQMWFQSIVSLDKKGKVIAFFVRYVPCRTAHVLQDWIIDFLADGAAVSTDSFASYYGLRTAAALRGVNIETFMVNHKECYKSSNGTHTNGVEGMHSHVKQYLRRMGSLGKEKTARIFRVLAAAQLCNPIDDTVETSRCFRLMRSLQLVVEFGVPVQDVLDGIVGSALPAFVVKENSKDVIGSPTRRRDRSAGRAALLSEYEEEERKKAVPTSVQESLKKKEAEEKKRLRTAKDYDNNLVTTEKARERLAKLEAKGRQLRDKMNK